MCKSMFVKSYQDMNQRNKNSNALRFREPFGKKQINIFKCKYFDPTY